MLEARRICGDERLFPGISTTPKEPQASPVRRRDDFQHPVAVDIAGGQKATQLVVQRSNNVACRWIGAGVVTANLDLATRDRLHGDVQLIAAITVDIPDQDLLGVTRAEIRDFDAILSRGRDVAYDGTRLRRAVHLIRRARRRVHLEGAIAVQIAELDLMDDRVWLGVKLVDGEAARAIGAQPSGRSTATTPWSCVATAIAAAPSP